MRTLFRPLFAGALALITLLALVLVPKDGGSALAVLPLLGLPLFDKPADQGADGAGDDSGEDDEQDGVMGESKNAQDGEKPEKKTPTAAELRKAQAEIDRKAQAEIDRKAQEKADAIVAERDRKAKQKQAKEQGKYQELAEGHESRIAELEPQAERATRYAELLNEQVEAEVAAWPEEVTGFDPGPADVDARLAWLKKARPLAEKLGTTPKAPDTDAGKGSRPSARKDAGGASGGASGNREAPKETYRFQQPGDVAW